MQIAAFMNIHSDPGLVADTLDSVFTYMTRDVLLVVDGASSAFDHVAFPVPKMTGFQHGCNRAPYRNLALGFKTVQAMHPKADWYCYIEPDCLVASERFRRNLMMAEERKIWMLGCDGRVDSTVQMPLVEALLHDSVDAHRYYLLGCCQFFHRDFVEKLVEIDFFDKFLAATNQFSQGYLPGYNGYDISEHLYPTLARKFGGNIGVFATYEQPDRWHGSYKVFPMRWQPQLTEEDDYSEASLLHPVKDVNHPIRCKRREERNVIRAAKSHRSRIRSEPSPASRQEVDRPCEEAGD
jgi:hypothetical protein